MAPILSGREVNNLKIEYMKEKICPNCKFFATQDSDSGYSNWSVTETEVHCMKKHFEPIEESYSWHKHPPKFFKLAESCIDYREESGTQLTLDVDGETTIEDFKSDDDVYQAAIEYFKP
jgi:hypothetical protein